MKRKYIYSSLVALALLATSCETVEPTLEGEAGEVEGGKISITLEAPTQPDGTRADMYDINTEWSVGDDVVFFNQITADSGTSKVPNLNNGTGFGFFEAESVDADGNATFTASSASGLGGVTVCGFYPGKAAYMNNTNTGVRFLYNLRLPQPTYFKLEYEDGVVTPSSMGQYSYLYFISEEDDLTLNSTTVSSLTGTYKHLMGYLDFNFANVTKNVERVYIVANSPVMEEAIVDMYGTMTCDKSLNYAITSDGDDSDSTVSTLSKFQIEDFVFMLTDATTSNLGVAPTAEQTLRVRLPIFPQTLSGTMDIYVVYTDGQESVVTISVAGVTVESGKRYFNDQTITLGAVQTANPKIGDYFWNDGTSSFTLDGATTPPDGIAYDWTGTGSSRTVGRVFSPTYIRESYLGTYYVTSSAYNKNLLLMNQTDKNGLCAMQSLYSLANSSTQSTGGNIFSQYSGDETFSTYYDYINSLVPAMGAVFSKTTGNPTYDPKTFKGTFSGDETYVWYVPTVYELYELYARVNAVQALRENFYVAQQIAIYDAGLYGVTKTSAYSWGNCGLTLPTVTKSSSVQVSDGTYFDSIISAYGTAGFGLGSNTNSIYALNPILASSTFRSDQAGSGYYVSLGNIYEIISVGSSDNYDYYGESGYLDDQVGNTYPTWSIMCVDAAGKTPNN